MVKMEHKFRKLCTTLVIFTRAASEKFHKNGATVCKKKKKKLNTPGISSYRTEIFISTLFETPTFFLPSSYYYPST
jgi:hypothetical protein